MNIRESVPQDKEIIIEMLNQILQYQIKVDTLGIRKTKPNYGKDKYEEIDEKGYMVVAEENNVVIGFGACYMKSENEGHISKLFVSEEFRTQGIGNKLLAYLENYLKQQGCNYISINVFYPNQIAYNWYKETGYTESFVDLIKKV